MVFQFAQESCGVIQVPELLTLAAVHISHEVISAERMILQFVFEQDGADSYVPEPAPVFFYFYAGVKLQWYAMDQRLFGLGAEMVINICIDHISIFNHRAGDIPYSYTLGFRPALHRQYNQKCNQQSG